ncbi:hypothetical protein VKT23_004612 [Stygiomarasmius scandens]|uniref:MYND-type domain-containing protein n=1 Tax=Marasmiellus scandens TaxID=2682957 RepID=A0ABR1JVH1_9AGAR
MEHEREKLKDRRRQLVMTCIKCNLAGNDSEIKIRLCSNCKLATYCSRKCQADDWPMHKAVCGGKIAGRGPMRLFQNFCSNEWLMEQLSFATVLLLGLKSECLPQRPVQVCLGVTIEPTNFSALSQMPKHVQGVLQISNIYSELLAVDYIVTTDSGSVPVIITFVKEPDYKIKYSFGIAPEVVDKAHKIKKVDFQSIFTGKVICLPCGLMDFLRNTAGLEKQEGFEPQGTDS